MAEENAAASAAKTDELSAHLFVRRADAHIYLAKRAATYSPCDAVLVVHERASHWLPLGTGLHVSRFLLSIKACPSKWSPPAPTCLHPHKQTRAISAAPVIAPPLAEERRSACPCQTTANSLCWAFSQTSQNCEPTKNFFFAQASAQNTLYLCAADQGIFACAATRRGFWAWRAFEEFL